jgi:hypothetical protein
VSVAFTTNSEAKKISQPKISQNRKKEKNPTKKFDLEKKNETKKEKKIIDWKS